LVKLKGALKQSMKGMTGLARDTSALVEPDFDTFEAHFSVTPSNSAGFRAPSGKKPRYMDC
jgi:hypothetical protein